jgi:hypothetical protein
LTAAAMSGTYQVSRRTYRFMLCPRGESIWGDWPVAVFGMLFNGSYYAGGNAGFGRQDRAVAGTAEEASLTRFRQPEDWMN